MSDTLVRLAVLLTIFGSVFVVSQLVLGAAWRTRAKTAAINRRLRMIREGRHRDDVIAVLRKNAPLEFVGAPPIVRTWLKGLQRNLFASGASITLTQLLAGMGIGFVTAIVLLLALAGSAGAPLGSGTIVLLLVLSACIAVALPMLLVSFIAQRRRKKVEQQFPISLDVFVRALRSGHPIASAIDLLTKEMEDPIGSEFGLVADEVAYGSELTDALDGMAERWNLEDMRMFVVSLSVQSETGGNLAEILENLSDVIRARASMFLKVRALSSEGRMTGWMLTVLPVVAFVSMFFVNPGFYLDVSQDQMFIVGFSGLVLLWLVGFIMIRRMIDLKV